LESLDEILSQSDVVVLTLPLTEETRHMMNEQRFAKMKDGSVLVNIARGAVVDEQALLKALNEKLVIYVKKKGPQADLKHIITYANNNIRRLKLDSEMRRKQTLNRECYIFDWIYGAKKSHVISKLEAEVIWSRYSDLTMQPDGLYALPSWRKVGRQKGLTSSEVKRIHDNAIDKLVNAINEGKIRALRF
jgi:hypothetical protein